MTFVVVQDGRSCLSILVEGYLRYDRDDEQKGVADCIVRKLLEVDGERVMAEAKEVRILVGCYVFRRLNGGGVGSVLQRGGGVHAHVLFLECVLHVADHTKVLITYICVCTNISMSTHTNRDT